MAIIIDCAQGSSEWIEARLGIPTASQFHRILTPKTMKLASAADGYAHELLAEELLGHAINESESQFMQRGTQLEQQAVRFYEFHRDVHARPVGVILADDGKAGCSPDRLVGDDGGLEIKCPSAAAHVAHMLSVDAEKAKCQVQGALWITGREWWDWLSYNPEMQPVIIRYQRDEVFIARLAQAIEQFNNYLDECRQRLVRDGFTSEEMVTQRATWRAEMLLNAKRATKGARAASAADAPVSATQRGKSAKSLADRAAVFETALRSAKTVAELGKIRNDGTELLLDLHAAMPAREKELAELGRKRAEQLAAQSGAR